MLWGTRSRWLDDNHLFLNEAKTEAILFRSSVVHSPSSLPSIYVCGSSISLSPTVRDIGVLLDSQPKYRTSAVLPIRIYFVLRKYVDHHILEEQVGFRRGSAYCEHTFTLRNITGQSKEFQKHLLVDSIDLKNFFANVHRESQILKLCHTNIIDIFKWLHRDTRCCIKTKDVYTDMFDTEIGVHPVSFHLCYCHLLCRG